MDIRKEDSEYSVLPFSEQQLATIFEYMGLTTEAARSMVNNPPCLMVDEMTNFRLYNVFNKGSVETIPQILENKKLEVVQMRNLRLPRIVEQNAEPLREEEINWYIARIGPHYPELIPSSKLTVVTPDGKKLEFLTWDLLQTRQLDQIFVRYQRWLEEQRERIGPQFNLIKQEVGDWLANKLEGINVQQDGFISWFIANKLHTLQVEIYVDTKRESNYKSPGWLVEAHLIIKDLTRQFSSDVMDVHLVEYGLWRQSRLNTSLFNGQNAITERAMIHQSSFKDHTTSVSGATVKQPTCESLDSSLFTRRKVVDSNPAFQESINLNANFLSLFNSKSDAHSCLSFMQKLNLIDATGVNRIGDREKYRLMALVEVLQQKNLLPSAYSTATLTTTIAQQIKMNYSRARNGDRKRYDDAMRTYLDKLNAVSTKNLDWSIMVDNGR